MRNSKLGVALVLFAILFAGCASAPELTEDVVKLEPSIPKESIDVKELEHGQPLGGLNSEIARVIRDPSAAIRLGCGGSLIGDPVCMTIPGVGAGLDNAHRTIKEAIHSYTEMSGPGVILDWSSVKEIMEIEKADQDTGKAIENLAFNNGASANTDLNRRPPNQSNSTAPPLDSTRSFQDRIGEFFATLKKAAYAFNPPSPITVAKPITIYLLLEPQGDAVKLADRIRELAPQDASRIVRGEAKWASVMEASLSGRDFDIEPSAPVRKTLNPSERAMWSWVITPKHPGEKLPLTLTAKAILPSDFAPPYEVILLQREIDVQVTMWWLFDHYFDKYWKWLLGGAAGLVTATFGWWWRQRTTPNPALKRTPRKRRAA
ncbi:hypothetical protein [Crenobacter intestini]|uniref:Uncharacterized protein n=1 Tax=Crenobacter intestini TaxID=2563443 RepID=A0A4T0UVV8_9NEIS|nr:hypothetical protein [Crenobacter intestini]TIC83200.1 hypothetical protein E5K04_08910 [Crenobacter intestini]